MRKLLLVVRGAACCWRRGAAAIYWQRGERDDARRGTASRSRSTLVVKPGATVRAVLAELDAARRARRPARGRARAARARLAADQDRTL